ncbi:MAG: DUF4886 domain-containing protein [Caldicoprobacterales bacterium]|jgi:hypothetical protein|nr:DUF4886 domain-containing protein [Clostridiales bacterium]
MKILSIGNSFSQDAHRYLHKAARADGFQMKCVNLVIGGCSLSQHFKNINNDAKAYSFEFNGEVTGIYVTIKEALQSDDWDYITIQQVSNQSISYETYHPYIQELSGYIRYHAPKSRLLLHQTWAYEQDSERLIQLGYEDPNDMFRDLKAAYEQAAEAISADGIIPAGQCMQNLLANGMEKVHRDTFHAGTGAARYAIALTWYGYLTGRPIEDNRLREFDQPVSEWEIQTAKLSARQALGQDI